jgi:hypothetical protein
MPGADGVVDARLRNQHLVRPRFAAPVDLVRFFGAIQAQDFTGSLWAIGQRLAGAVEADVAAAVASRAIVRTWPMRGTLHFVPAKDVRWMLALLEPRLTSGNVGRHRQLGLAPADFARARKVLTRSLEGGRRLTRPSAYELLKRGGVSPAGQRGIHLVGHLAQKGLLCFGPWEGKQPTFVLLDEWVPRPAEPSREEALARLATAYFRSHGPATLRDFAWWSGLLAKDAEAAVHEAGGAIVRDARGDRTTWTGAAALSRARARPSAALLPPWDEYLVAYKDREAALGHLTSAPPPMVIGNALVVIDGRVRGTWQRSRSASAIGITLRLWSAVTEGERRSALLAAQRYGRFVGKPAAIEIR